MRNVLRSLALISAVALPMAAHASICNIPNDYCGTVTLTTGVGFQLYDTTTNSGIGQSPFDFGTLPNTTKVTIEQNGTPVDNEAVTLTITFLDPSSGTGGLGGTYTVNGSSSNGKISWNPTVATLADGQTVDISVGGSQPTSIGPGGNSTQTETLDFTLGSPVSAATPEPSSLALLGTGVLGLAGLVRRRMNG